MANVSIGTVGCALLGRKGVSQSTRQGTPEILAYAHNARLRLSLLLRPEDLLPRLDGAIGIDDGARIGDTKVQRRRHQLPLANARKDSHGFTSGNNILRKNTQLHLRSEKRGGEVSHRTEEYTKFFNR